MYPVPPVRCSVRQTIQRRHQAEPEDGRRDAEEREAHRAAVDDRAPLDGREDADRDARDEPDDRAPAISHSVRGARWISLSTETPPPKE